jgi:tetratricopeptide (TPR) repeat protein
MNNEELLSRVEAYLLPRIILEDTSVVDHTKYDFHTLPKKRFNDLLFELTVADHVRTMQTIYRDSYDEQHLFEEVRGFGSQLNHVPAKDLLEKIIDGRSKLTPLSKLCYGPNHLNTQKCILDLGTAYAFHALWSQAHEKALELSSLLKNEKETPEMDYSTGFECASRMVKVYRCIRNHVVRNQGKVLVSVINEIINEFETAAVIGDNEGSVPHPSRLAASLHAFFSSSSKLRLKKYSASYFDSNDHTQGDHQSPKSSSGESKVRSWGEVVDFLRNKCDVMKIWIETAESILLPQNKALLLLPFRYCDPSHRNLAHCIQLSLEIPKFPLSFKIISGSLLLKKVAEMNVAVPLHPSLLSGSSNIQSNDSQPKAAVILYELPLTLEEFVCMYILECRNYIIHQKELLLIQTMSLSGITSSYLGNLEAAESVFTEALHKLEMLGLDMELCACELFNSIAQMMMKKYTVWINNKKIKLKNEVEDWVNNNEEGKRLVRLEIKNIKNEQQQLHKKTIPLAELQHHAKSIVYKAKIKEYFQNSANESSEMRKLLDVSSRYLIRSYEILETYHSTNQTIVGTSCLAVASVQNLLKDYEECREWLLRALRIFEKSSPLPVRTISFAQIQLANVLKKLNHEDEARRVLVKALEFHKSQTKLGLMQYTQSNVLGQGPGGEGEVPTPSLPLSPIIFKNTSLSDEIDTYMKLTKEVIDLSFKCGDKWEASLFAEDLSHVVETAYGWDSVEASETFKDVCYLCFNFLLFIPFPHLCFLSGWFHLHDNRGFHKSRKVLQFELTIFSVGF